jgi:hypothetical protein
MSVKIHHTGSFLEALQEKKRGFGRQDVLGVFFWHAKSLQCTFFTTSSLPVTSMRGSVFFLTTPNQIVKEKHFRMEA